MKNRIRLRIAAAMFVALSLVGFTATGAWAFYKSGGCSTSVGYMNLTNYSYGSGQQYHWSTHPKYSYWKNTKVYASGVLIANGSGVLEGYRTYSSPTSTHTFKAVWYAADPDGGTISCSYTL